MAIVTNSFANIEMALGILSPRVEQLDESPSLERCSSALSLSKTTIDHVREKFIEWGHSPSDDHWRGLIEIAETYEGMATEEIKPARFMSSLPPGMGKTTVAIEATKAFLQDDRFKDEGVIYFLSRLEEIETLVRLMGLPRGDFAGLTSDAEINALGNPIPEKARVLFTTQQRLEAYAKGGTAFADMKDLHYKGRPRKVRVWDEAILPSMTLTLSKDGLFGLLKELRPNRPELANEIEDFAISLRGYEGERITIPDIDRERIELEEFKSCFSSPTSKDDAEALWYLSGRVVRVRIDNLNGTTSLDYEDILPPDLAPMLILDASGGLRKTYRFWQENRGGLELLYSPQKSYSGLTIHHWNKGAGKTKHRHWKDVNEIAAGVVKMIAAIPDSEDVLVVHYKARPKAPDIVRAIQDRLPSRPGSVKFCNWGKHTATNEFASIRHVILAGILQYNAAQYEAAGRAAKRATVDDDFSETDFIETRIGEISHHIFQAAGRGAIRKTENGGCPDGCHLYAIFSTHKATGLPRDQLSVIFPDSTVLDWSPEAKGEAQKRLTGKVREAYEHVVSNLEYRNEITTTEVRQCLGMNRNNWSDNILKHRDFISSLKGVGIILEQEKGKAGTFRSNDRI